MKLTKEADRMKFDNNFQGGVTFDVLVWSEHLVGELRVKRRELCTVATIAARC